MMKTLLGATLGLVLAQAVGAAETAAPAAASKPPLPYGAPVTLETARACAKAAVQTATANGWFMVVTVLDAGGHLVLTERMDNAQFGSVEPSRQKAYTAVAFRRSTKVFEDMIAQGGSALRLLKLPDALPIEGGLPLVKDGKVIGAVGTSGGSAQQDGVVAQSCVDVLGQ